MQEEKSIEPAHPPLTRQGNFVKLWTGQSAALIGYEISEMALPLLAILVLETDAGELGIIGAARWLPFLLFSLWAGVWIERRRRIPVMITADLTRAALMIAVVSLALTDLLTLPILIAAVFLLGAGTVMFDISYTTVLPSVVPQEQLVKANGFLQASGSVAQVGGPGLAGVLVQWLTAPITLLGQALSFLVSGGCLAAMKIDEKVPEQPEHRPNGLTSLKEGLVMAFGDPVLRSLVGIGALFNMFSQWVVAMFPLFAIREIGLSAGTMGAVVSAAAVGGLVGSMTVGRLSERIGPGRVIIASSVIASIPFALVAFSPERHAIAIPWLIASFAVAGYGWTIGGIMITSVRQAYTPRAFLARVNATYRFLGYGLVSVGVFAGGVLGEATSLRTTLLVGAIGSMTAIVWSTLSPLRGLRKMPAQEA